MKLKMLHHSKTFKMYEYSIYGHLPGYRPMSLIYTPIDYIPSIKEGYFSTMPTILAGDRKIKLKKL